mmetsp:Transcript_1349/g.3611  ORF Transcript_1349/g.3611 Transcript_1349/m.3611 type:complete len:306 (-) Transcript_1349:754-1671(-)
MFHFLGKKEPATKKEETKSDEQKTLAFNRVVELLANSEHSDEEPEFPVEHAPNSMIWRFLRAYSYDSEHAAMKLSKYLRWRASRSYGIDCAVRQINLTTPGVQRQIDTNKAYFLKGKDRSGRDVIIVHVKHHDPKYQSVDEITVFGSYMLLCAEASFPHSSKLEEWDLDLEEQKLCIVFDLHHSSPFAWDLQAAKRIIYILSNFFPERLGVCLLAGAPALFSTVWMVIKPWLNPHTQAKVRFVDIKELGKTFIDPSILPPCLGGTAADAAAAGTVACCSLEALRASTRCRAAAWAGEGARAAWGS